MWKYNCQKANKMFVLIKFIIMFAIELNSMYKILLYKNLPLISLNAACTSLFVLGGFFFKNLYS